MSRVEPRRTAGKQKCPDKHVDDESKIHLSARVMLRRSIQFAPQTTSGTGATWTPAGYSRQASPSHSDPLSPSGDRVRGFQVNHGRKLGNGGCHGEPRPSPLRLPTHRPNGDDPCIPAIAPVSHPLPAHRPASVTGGVSAFPSASPVWRRCSPSAAWRPCRFRRRRRRMRSR